MTLTIGLLLETKQVTYSLSSDKSPAAFSLVPFVVTILSFRRKLVVFKQEILTENKMYI